MNGEEEIEKKFPEKKTSDRKKSARGNRARLRTRKSC